MSAAARAPLGILQIADNAVSASFRGVLDAKKEAVAEIVHFPVRPRVSPVTLVSRTTSTQLPSGHYISIDLEDFE